MTGLKVSQVNIHVQGISFKKKKLKKKKLNNLKKVNKKPLKNQRFFYCLICA